MPPKIVVVCGPTASGKTGLGIGLAQALNGEVVSADSMQIYRGMDIGTAKPTPEERAMAVHHMIDVADPGEDYSVGRYVEQAGVCVDDILARGKPPIVVGGTGLYIDSLVLGRQFAPFAGEIRAELTRRMEAEGAEALLAELGKIDPDRAARLHANDEKRIIRALEIFYETGKTISQHDEESKTLPPRYEAATVFLNYEDRADLWARIDQRVDEMVEEGLVAGGGVALINASVALSSMLEEYEGDEKTGIRIVLKGIEEPVRQIALNAGLEGSVIIDKIVTSGKVNFGYDFASEQYVDMFSAGIVDPTKVTRSALQNAASVAAMVLTTESLVTDKKEPAPAAPAAPAMDGMY